MEPNIPINSIPQSPQPSQVSPQTDEVQRRPAYKFWLKKIALVFISSVILGGILTTAIIMLPYNRVVLRPQIRGTYINITSIHLKDPGYVAVYLQVESGLLLVGSSHFLVPGYYQHVAIFIATEPVRADEGRLLIVRMFEDNGDKLLDEFQDKPIRNVFGGLYQKRASMFYPRKRLQQWWLYFLDDPLVVISDTLIP